MLLEEFYKKIFNSPAIDGAGIELEIYVGVSDDKVYIATSRENCSAVLRISKEATNIEPPEDEL